MPVFSESKQFTDFEILQRDHKAVIVHHDDERGLWATNDREILFRRHANGDWETIAIFPAAMPRDLFAWSRLTRRAMRVDKCNLFPTAYGKLLGIRAGVAYQIERGGLQPLFPLNGDCVLHRSICETADGHIYLGEYFMNPNREPVRLWRVASNLQHYEVAYTFPGGSIRHIHGVYLDPYHKNRLWITVGDYEGECYVLFTDDHFETINRIGDGSQLWRAVGLMFTSNAIIWITDSHMSQNYIVSMDRDSHQITMKGEVENSAWYSLQTSDGVFLAGTTVEVGNGIHSNRASLLASKNGIDWEVVASFKKDRFPMKFFKFGVLSFPSGKFDSGRFWISGEALEGLDGRSVLCRLSSSGDNPE